MCTLISWNSICLLCINISSVYPVSGTMHGERYPAVVVVPIADGDIVDVGEARAYRVISVSGGSFGCTIAPYRIVACAGGEIVGSFA